MPLRFCLLNAQGLTSKRTNKLKSSEFENIFSSTDIILIIEIWTDEYADIEVNDFDAFVLHRKRKVVRETLVASFYMYEVKTLPETP